VAPDVQDAETVVKQLMSGEIWGYPAKWGGIPTVKAFSGKLSATDTGIEFWSFQAPESLYGPRVYWRTHGPFVTIDDITDTAKLHVAFVRITQDLLP
jgi:hypothetical protein